MKEKNFFIEKKNFFCRAFTGAGPFKCSVEVNPLKIQANPLVVKSVPENFFFRSSSKNRLAAKSLLRDLEEGRSYLHDNNGNSLHGNDRIVKEITRLSIQ